METDQFIYKIQFKPRKFRALIGYSYKSMNLKHTQHLKIKITIYSKTEVLPLISFVQPCI